MGIYLPHITIVEVEGTYQFDGSDEPIIVAMGNFPSLKEGVSTILAETNLWPLYRTELEEFQKKAEEVQWNEGVLSALYMKQ